MGSVLTSTSNKLEMMKKLLPLAVFLIAFQFAQGQLTDTLTTETNQELYDYFITKHKKQNKTGLILLGTGLAAMGTGLLIASSDDDWGDGFVAGGYIFYAGVLTTISSIPVLIISGSNKRKAQTYVQVGQQQSMDFAVRDSKLYSVGIKIEF